MNQFKQDLESVSKVDLSDLVIKLGFKTKAGTEALKVAIANCLLLDRKQIDYGPKNVSAFGSFGVMVRLNDKMERLKTIYTKKGRKRSVINESINDSFRDMSNYATIALLIELGLWPNE